MRNVLFACRVCGAFFFGERWWHLQGLKVIDWWLFLLQVFSQMPWSSALAHFPPGQSAIFYLFLFFSQVHQNKSLLYESCCMEQWWWNIQTQNPEPRTFVINFHWGNNYQWDLLEAILEFVEAVDLKRHPNLYRLRAWLKSLTWMETRLSISIPPFGSVWTERLYIDIVKLY